MMTAAQASSQNNQTIYRCGIDGKVFSDKPCENGRAIVIKSDEPDADRRQEARDVAARESKLAAQLRSERLALDAQRVTAPSGFHPRGEAKPTADDAPSKKRIKPRTVHLPSHHRGNIHRDQETTVATLKAK